MRRLAAQKCGPRHKFFDKESPAHATVCYINRMGSCAQPARSLLTCGVSAFLLAIFSLARPASIFSQTRAQAAPLRRAVIIDTDAGSDDLMAIAFLLSRGDIRVEGITIVNGMAHVQAGGRNVLRLLELAGRRDIPVFLGRETPLSGNAEFPAAWRKASDDLPGVTLH